MRVLLLDRDIPRRKSLAALLRAALPDVPLTFEGMAQHDVFEQPPGADCAVVLIWISGMLDLEAARQLSRVSPQVPVVICTDSQDYGMESYAVKAVYYLMHPIDDTALHRALERCGLIRAKGGCRSVCI